MLNVEQSKLFNIEQTDTKSEQSSTPSNICPSSTQQLWVEPSVLEK
jgi:hypothetical protein